MSVLLWVIIIWSNFSEYFNIISEHNKVLPENEDPDIIIL